MKIRFIAERPRDDLRILSGIILSNKFLIAAGSHLLIGKAYNNVQMIFAGQVNNSIVGFINSDGVGAHARDGSDIGFSDIRRADINTFELVVRYTVNREGLYPDLHIFVVEGISAVDLNLSERDTVFIIEACHILL